MMRRLFLGLLNLFVCVPVNLYFASTGNIFGLFAAVFCGFVGCWILARVAMESEATDV
jgi:hypothetical protein